MNNQIIIIYPNPKNTDAPSVSLHLDSLFIVEDSSDEYNYAVSTDNGSVLQKGKFQKEIELRLEASSTSKLLQLDVFNSNDHFTYNFTLSKKSPKA